MVDVPDGTTVRVSTDGVGATGEEAIPPEVADAIEKFVPSRYREGVVSYLERCVAELGCNVSMPDSDRKNEYVNLYPPPQCRRARVSAVTYSSSRTGVFTGDIDLDDYELAEKTYNGDRYAYPKLPHLDSRKAVDEAIALSKIAIARLER
jgi:hypothetical protein